MKAIPITNVALHSMGQGSNSVSVCCELNGARYHVWVSRDAPEVVAKSTYDPYPILYKNSPLHLKPTDPGNWRTRKLDASNKANAPLVAAMFERVRDGKLWALLAVRDAAEERERQARIAAARFEHKLTKSAPALYEALLVVEHETRRGGQWTLAEVNEHVRAVLEAAGLEIPDRLEGLTPDEA